MLNCLCILQKLLFVPLSLVVWLLVFTLPALLKGSLLFCTAGACHHTLQRCLLQKHHKSLGSYPEHLYFAGGPLPCLAPVTLAITFSSTSLLAALSRSPPPNKVVSFSLSVSTISRCTIIGLTYYLLSLSCVIG